MLAGDTVRRVIAPAGGRAVVVDPAGTDPTRYRGATVVKPNLPELAALTGMPVATDAQTLAAGVRLAETLAGSSVLLTRGGDGMVLFNAGRPPRILPASQARRVFDVTGAGDTAAATLALALAAGYPLELAARLANAAAGVPDFRPADRRGSLGRVRLTSPRTGAVRSNTVCPASAILPAWTDRTVPAALGMPFAEFRTCSSRPVSWRSVGCPPRAGPDGSADFTGVYVG